MPHKGCRTTLTPFPVQTRNSQRHVAESLLMQSSAVSVFEEDELFSVKALRLNTTNVIDILRDYEKLLHSENEAIVRNIVKLGFKQISESVSQGYKTSKLSRRVKVDLFTTFVEETETFLDTMLYPLFPVEEASVKWLKENKMRLQKELQPKCTAKGDSMEEHEQLQQSIRDKVLKAQGLDDAAKPAPPRATRPARKSSIAVDGSPGGEAEAAPSKKAKAPPKGLQGAFDAADDSFSDNVAKMFKNVSKGQTNPMEMAALMAVTEYMVKKEGGGKPSSVAPR